LLRTLFQHFLTGSIRNVLIITKMDSHLIRQKALQFLSGPIQIDLRAELEVMKERAAAQRKKEDLLWRELCGLTATHGSVVHAEEFMAMYDERLAFHRLPANKEERTRVIFNALKDAKVPRFREEKSENLSSNYDRVKGMGGPEEATKVMLSLKGKKQKIKWIRQFDGVGEKYSRDIWMDIYDPDFHDSIALDARVKNFAKLIGLNATRSEDLEKQLLDFARECNLSGWELDRLIFNFGELILQKLKHQDAVLNNQSLNASRP